MATETDEKLCNIYLYDFILVIYNHYILLNATLYISSCPIYIYIYNIYTDKGAQYLKFRIGLDFPKWLDCMYIFKQMSLFVGKWFFIYIHHNIAMFKTTHSFKVYEQCFLSLLYFALSYLLFALSYSGWISLKNLSHGRCILNVNGWDKICVSKLSRFM